MGGPQGAIILLTTCLLDLDVRQPELMLTMSPVRRESLGSWTRYRSKCWKFCRGGEEGQGGQHVGLSLHLCRKRIDAAVGWGQGDLTFLTFLFHSSFATCTLTVFGASPDETTMPLSSLENAPEGVLVTVLAAAETAGATALADIACRAPPVVI